MRYKSKYVCIVFFANAKPKKWSTDKLDGFAAFLNKEHPAWEYMNVYEQKTQFYLTRFYPYSLIPQTYKP